MPDGEKYKKRSEQKRHEIGKSQISERHCLNLLNFGP